MYNQITLLYPLKLTENCKSTKSKFWGGGGGVNPSAYNDLSIQLLTRVNEAT